MDLLFRKSFPVLILSHKVLGYLVRLQQLTQTLSAQPKAQHSLLEL